MKILSKIPTFLLVAVFVVTFSSCSEDGSGNRPKDFEPIPISRSEEGIVKADNIFAYKLFDAVDSRAGEHENYVISPLSVSITLAMAANGASGETLDEMLDVLGFEQQDIAGLNTFYKKMLDRLPALDNTTTVNIANALWINKDYTTKTYDMFSGNMRDFYGSPIMYLDDITSDATHQEITKGIQNISLGTLSEEPESKLIIKRRALLQNAFYLKGICHIHFLGIVKQEGTLKN